MRFAGAELRRHPWLLLSAVLTAATAVLAVGLVRDAVLPTRPVLGIAATVATALIETIALLALVRISLDIRERGVSDLWPFVDCADLVLAGFGAFVLIGLSVLMAVLPVAVLALFVGLMATVFEPLQGLTAFLVGLAVILALSRLSRYLFSPHVIVDRRGGAFQALRTSVALTAGRQVQAFLLLVFILALNLLGMLLAGIGLLLSFPLSLLFLAHAYRSFQVPAQEPGASVR